MVRRLPSFLARHARLASISVFSLAIAIALGVVGFSLSNTMLILAPSAPEANRLVTIYNRGEHGATGQISYPDFQYYRAHNHVFTDIAAAPDSVGLNDDFHFEGRDVKLVTRPVSENYFDVLGIRPYLGRFFSPGDDRRKDLVAVMTWSCWTRLGSDPHIIGKVLARHTILGVAPKQFTGSFYGFDGDLLTTLGQYDDNANWFQQRDARALILTARLRRGADRRQAQAEMSMLAAQLGSAYPKEDRGWTAVVTRATLLAPEMIPLAELMSAILLTMILLVLLIASANVANLLLAIAVSRRQEAAIKLALGASRGRLIGGFLKESAVLCFIGGAGGFALAAALVSRASRFSLELPTIGTFSLGIDLRLDGTVLAATGAMMLIAILVTGLAPALYASSPGIAQILSGEMAIGGTGKNVRRNALVVVQVAACTAVLAGMGLAERNLYNLRHVNPGFSARNLIANTVHVAGEGYDETRGRELYRTLRRTMAALPGVESVTLASNLPLLGYRQIPVRISADAAPAPVPSVVVGENYFSTFGIGILSGRAFDSRDRADGPGIAVINRKMAEMFFPGKDPVGRTILAGNPPRRLTIVGVAADGKYLDLDEPPTPFLYSALSQNYFGGINVIARTAGDPALWVQPMSRALRGLGLKIMIQPVTLQNWMNLTLLTQRIAAACVGTLSALGLVLAASGLFGAISYSISERKRELGIRVALGARPAQLMNMVLRQTMATAGAGVAAGCALGAAGTILFRSRLFGIAVIEWSVLIPAAAAMLLVSLATAYVSARPWIRVDALDALRHI